MKQKEYTSLKTCLDAAIAATSMSEFIKKSVLKVSTKESQYQSVPATYEKHRLHARLWIYLLEKHDFIRANEWWEKYKNDIQQTLDKHYKGIPHYTQMTHDWKVRDFLIEHNLILDKPQLPYRPFNQKTVPSKTIEEVLNEQVEKLKIQKSGNAFNLDNNKNPYYAYIEHANPKNLTDWLDILQKTKERVYGKYPDSDNEFKDELRVWAFVRKGLPMPITLFLLRGDYYPAMILGSGHIQMDAWDLACARVLLHHSNKILSLRRLKNDSHVADNLRYNNWPPVHRLDSGLLHLAENVIPALEKIDEFEDIYKALVELNPNAEKKILSEIAIENTWVPNHD